MGRKAIEKARKSKNEKTDQWLRALLPKLQDKELSGLTMDDLAALIPKSKSTLYDYFGSRDEMIIDAVNLKTTELRRYNEVVKETDTLMRYQKLIEFLGEGLHDIHSGFLAQLPKAFPGAWELVQQFQSEIIKALSGLYIKGMEEGVFRQAPLQLVVGMDIHFINEVITDHDLSGIPLKELINYYVEMRLKGLEISSDD
jgi:AcrR family transcriptional regulator